MKNLAQFVTGRRGKDVPNLETLKSFAPQATCGISADERSAILETVFKEKAILLGDATLEDTVVPREEWSLKADRKLTGCLCCVPDSDSDEEEGDGVGGREGGLRRGGGEGVKSGGLARGWRDGKAGFAFMPPTRR